MTKEFDEAVKKYFQNIFLVQGMDNSASNIVSTLFLETKEIPMDKLAEKTGYSLATISNKIKLFEPMGLIKRIKKPGSKRIYLYMEKDFIRGMKKAMQIKQESVIRFAKEKLPLIINKGKASAKTKEDKEKIKIIQNYYKQVLYVEELVKDMIIKLNKIEIA